MTDQFIGQVLGKKYRVDSLLRESDLGNIYRGTHVSMDKPVTIKILAPALSVDENIVRQFSAEAKTASQISHSNIFGVTDFAADANKTTYIVFEGAEGATLKETIFAEGKFNAERAVNITRQIASALTAANAANIVHGGLNSENILLAHAPDGSEIAKVLDFGAVRSNHEEPSAADVEYLSPEQYADAETDERSNVYSLGVILYEMLAGEVPFAGLSPTDVMLKHSQEPPPPLSAFRHDLPAALEPVVLQALAKNPEMRFQTAREFSDALARVSTDKIETVTPEKASAASAGNVNNIWKTAFIVLAGVSLLSIALIYATMGKRSDPTTSALQTDANGQPVQPINPATGADEQNLAAMSSLSPEMMSNSNVSPMAVPPGTLPGGDGVNPWANGGSPPPGAPQYVPPGPYVQIDPNNPNSPFMPNESGVVLVPVPANTSVNANVKPSPTPKNQNAAVPANTAPSPAPSQTPKPNASPAPDIKVTPIPKPEKTPAKPTPTPKTNSPAATEKKNQSGQPQDGF